MLRPPEDIFNEDMLPYGGRLDPSGLADYLQFYKNDVGALARTLAAKSIGAGPLNLHFDYVNNSKVNAFAFISGGYDFIGMFIGLPIVMQHLFGRMLSHPGTFPHIGDPTNEAPPSAWEKLPSSIEDLLSQEVPVDSTRREFANFLAALAVQYVISHELAHLRHGHASYLMRTGYPPLSEKPNQMSASIDSLTYQALEMDADSFAVVDVATSALTMHSDQSYFPLWRQFLSTPALALELTIAAVFAFHRLHFGLEWQPGALDTLSHPPGPVRYNWLMGTIDNWLSGHDPYRLYDKQDDIRRNAVLGKKPA